jgi:hypothetical protein
MESKNA